MGFDDHRRANKRLVPSPHHRACWQRQQENQRGEEVPKYSSVPTEQPSRSPFTAVHSGLRRKRQRVELAGRHNERRKPPATLLRAAASARADMLRGLHRYDTAPRRRQCEMKAEPRRLLREHGNRRQRKAARRSRNVSAATTQRTFIVKRAHASLGRRRIFFGDGDDRTKRKVSSCFM